MQKFSFILLFLLMGALFIVSCDREEDNVLIPDLNESELIVKEKNGTVESVFNDIETAIANKGLTTIAKIDHAANAANVNMSLRPTRTIIFGNPEQGTRLMQSDQRIGIDLPMKFVVWEDDDGDIQVGYYNATTLTQRYSINNQTDVVTMIDNVMEEISGGDPAESPDDVNDITSKLVVKQSPMSVRETFDKVVAAIEAKSDLNIVAEVEHDVAASNANLQLRPTKLVIFGNPAVGTRFMEVDQRMGIDLPLKILVWEDASGQTWIGYYDADTLTDRYDILTRDEEADIVNDLMIELTNEAVIQ